MPFKRWPMNAPLMSLRPPRTFTVTPAGVCRGWNFIRLSVRRLTFMVISQTRGQFEAKDLPTGTYSVQGVGAGYESNWFTNVNVTAGDSAKVGLALTNKQGAMLLPAWPKRLPQDQVAKVSKVIYLRIC